MEQEPKPIAAADMAAEIAEFRKDELDNFVRSHLRHRDLHKVVANLNESVLSEDDPRAQRARNALKLLGFPD